MSVPQNQTSINPSTIYEGGNLMQIGTADLLNNEVAIKQILNAHNISLQEIAAKNQKITDLEGDLQFLKTSPFIAIVASVVNLAGTAVAAMGINFVTDNSSNHILGWGLVSTGTLIVLVGSLATILYPYAKRAFN